MSDIFKKPFSGSIEELIEFTQNNADIVEKVLSGQEDIPMTDDEVIEVIIEDNPSFTREQAKRLLDELKLDMVNECVEELVAQGYLELVDYDYDNQPRYAFTPEGEKKYKDLFDKP